MGTRRRMGWLITLTLLTRRRRRRSISLRTLLAPLRPPLTTTPYLQQPHLVTPAFVMIDGHYGGPESVPFAVVRWQERGDIHIGDFWMILLGGQLTEVRV
jgi:hypothetical protein